MQDNTIFVKRYSDDSGIPKINEREIWRYAGYLGNINGVDERLQSELDTVERECSGIFSYKVCYRRMDIFWNDDMPVLPFACDSKKLALNLGGCSEMILFAATIGIEIDRYITRYQKISPVKALLMQAYGAERIESLCDMFCGEIETALSKEDKFCHPRYSPGYGDLPLTVQKEVFRLLDCNRQIGIALNDSLLMTPSKSVTAIMGIEKRKNSGSKEVAVNKCGSCDNRDCEFRMSQAKTESCRNED